VDRERSLPHVLKLVAGASSAGDDAHSGTYNEPSCGFTDAFRKWCNYHAHFWPEHLLVGGRFGSSAHFDAGRRRANLDQAIAAYDQTVANYRETVLTGFQQVEDNVAALRILEKEAQVQNRPVVAAQKYLELANIRYVGGVTSYLEVTTAQSAALSDELTAVNILGRRMVDAVTPVQALGGGWDRSTLPERPECCGKLTNNSK
jgi:Outer membrane efflux protein